MSIVVPRLLIGSMPVVQPQLCLGGVAVMYRVIWGIYSVVSVLSGWVMGNYLRTLMGQTIGKTVKSQDSN